MERTTGLAEAKQIMGNNLIGPDELASVANQAGIIVPSRYPEIPFENNLLTEKKDDCLLILGLSQMSNGDALTLKSLRSRFGTDPDISEPCFYNQDWYKKEDFMSKPLGIQWFLLNKSLIPKTRGIHPLQFTNDIQLPSAILCAYAFFCNYLVNRQEILWKHDFIWCSDKDSNDDMVYVGRYVDPTGFSRNGFSIHRHLSIRNNYGSVFVQPGAGK